MTRPCRLAASLICADMLNLEAEIKRLQGNADSVHLDVMDGVFVPRFGLPPEILRALRRLSSIPVDVHLMVVDPEPYLETFAQAGANVIAFHVEPTLHIQRLLDRIRRSGVQAGIALNPATSLDVLEYVLEELSLVVVMGINPGIVGDGFVPTTTKKLGRLRDTLSRIGHECTVAVDGGVTEENAADLLDAGADMLVCGSRTIFSPGAPVNVRLEELRRHLADRGFARQ
jgi:ribulose-phosphate 3-epimerase